MICGSIGSKTFIYDLYKTKKRCLNCAILPVGWAKQAKISRAIHGLLASGTMKGYQIVDLGYGSSRLHLVPLLVPWLSAILNISCSGRFVARRGRLWQESNGKSQWFSDSKKIEASCCYMLEGNGKRMQTNLPEPICHTEGVLFNIFLVFLMGFVECVCLVYFRRDPDANDSSWSKPSRV